MAGFKAFAEQLVNLLSVKEVNELLLRFSRKSMASNSAAAAAAAAAPLPVQRLPLEEQAEDLFRQYSRAPCQSKARQALSLLRSSAPLASRKLRNSLTVPGVVKEGLLRLTPRVSLGSSEEAGAEVNQPILPVTR